MNPGPGWCRAWNAPTSCSGLIPQNGLCVFPNEHRRIHDFLRLILGGLRRSHWKSVTRRMEDCAMNERSGPHALEQLGRIIAANPSFLTGGIKIAEDPKRQRLVGQYWDLYRGVHRLFPHQSF